MNSKFWYGKKVFLTGHTGFKGSWLALWLQKMGAEVKGFALNPPTTPNLFIEAKVAENMSSEIGDICDYDKIYKSISNFTPEIVFHMAAQSLVRLSYDKPVETYKTNVMGTVHLLDAIRKVGSVKAVINITSDKCYENQEWAWGYRENERLGGYDPYSNSKGCAELVTSAFRKSFFNNNNYQDHGCALASARAGNVIGGGDWALDRLIPDILKAFENKKAVVIRNPDSIRPWQHVLEPLYGYMVLAEKLYTAGVEFAEAWNFGPCETEVKSVQWMVEQLGKYWGEDAKWGADNLRHPHEAHFLKLDCSLARMKLGWQPIWDTDYTLQKIVAWHKNWLKKEDMQLYSLHEIEEYVAAKTGLGLC